MFLHRLEQNLFHFRFDILQSKNTKKTWKKSGLGSFSVLDDKIWVPRTVSSETSSEKKN